MSKNEMKLLGRNAIEAYPSEAGFICLSQEGSLGENPSVVVMLPQDIPTVVSWLQQLAAEQSAQND